MPTIRARGKGFQAQVRIKENGIIVYQESATWGTKSEATLWGLQLEESIKRNGYTARVTERVTVRQLLEQYGEHRARVAALGKGFEHSLNAVAYSPLGSLSLDQLTSAKIVAWAMTLHDKGLQPATVLHHLAILRAAINSAHALFDIEVSPEPVKLAIAKLRDLRVVGASMKRDRRVSDAEIAQLVAARSDDRSFIALEGFVRLAVCLPRRREELMRMLWANVNYRSGTVLLLDTKDPRKQRNETVPLPPDAQALMATMPKRDARVLPYKPESVSAAFQRAVRKAGLVDLRLHDLRHEGISRLFEQGLSIEDVALISGHTSWATLKRYTHLRPEQVTEKLRKLQHDRRQGQAQATAQSEQPRKNSRPRTRRSAG